MKTCACGHPAYAHASQQQIDARIEATGGRYSVECRGVKFALSVAHCTCTASSEKVEAS